MHSYKHIQIIIAAAAIGFATGSYSITLAKDETVGGKMSTAKTQDIINTLRSRGSFHKMLDGLEIAYNMDNTLKDKGPFTVFACDDKGWGKLNQADQDTLFGNKKKLAQVLSYQILKGEQLNSHSLELLSTIKSMEGHKIHLSMQKSVDKNKPELYVDKAHIKTADIQCSNGIIHITDEPIMPPLAQ